MRKTVRMGLSDMKIFGYISRNKDVVLFASTKTLRKVGFSNGCGDDPGSTRQGSFT